MNNIFDFTRFGKYFLYDLRNAKNNYGLSLLILGTMPVTLFVAYQLLSLIFTQRIADVNIVTKYMQFAIALTVAILGAGTKLYGNLTEKRAGANFLMIPASSFEKWLSMSLIVCVVLPFVLLALQLCSDAVMAFIFPNSYGNRFFELTALQYVVDTMEEAGITINLPAIFFLDWCESVLTFTVGAVCFKRSKIAKTILCLFAFSMITSTIAMIFVGNSGTMYIDWFDKFTSPADAARALNWLINIGFIVFVGGLLGGLYYRVRTLKH